MVFKNLFNQSSLVDIFTEVQMIPDSSALVNPIDKGFAQSLAGEFEEDQEVKIFKTTS